jgi:hypothetical protein
MLTNDLLSNIHSLKTTEVIGPQAAEFMKTHIFGFPVHQDLIIPNLNKIADEFKKAYDERVGH